MAKTALIFYQRKKEGSYYGNKKTIQCTMRIISHMPLDCNTELIEKTLLKTIPF